MVLRRCILFVCVECSIVSVRFIWFIKSTIYNISLFTFCVDCLFIVECRVLMFTTVKQCVN